jgi:Sec-independent protein translocase protein TatA
MIQYRDRQRQKAFIGAIIGAAASIAGGIIKGNKQKKAQEKAQAEAQAAQDHKDALQNAQALTSAYANQDYVDQYNDKLTLKCGGRVRRKAGFGTEFAQALPGLGNLASSITGVQGLGELGTAIGQGISANQQINENKRIAQEAEQRKQLQAGQQQLNITSDKMTNPMTMYQRSSFINKYKCGGRRKAWIGAAIGAAESLIGGMFGSKGQQPIKVEQADQASYSAPKTGIERPEWITNGTVQQPVMPQSVYRDRLNVYRCGGHRR